jgi:Tol biopolymer transport system component
MSSDGRFVVFESDAENLVRGHGDCVLGCVFLRDRAKGTTTWIAEGERPWLSADGRFIAFQDDQVFVYDREKARKERIADGEHPALSADGRFVAFLSYAPLFPGDTKWGFHVVLYDRVTRTIERISSSGAQAVGVEYGLSLSRDARFVAFVSESSKLVPGDTNRAEDVFLRDRVEGTTERISVGGGGAQAATGGRLPHSPSESISADGRIVAFESASANLVARDTNGTLDVFVRDRANATTRRVSLRDGAEIEQPSSLESLSGDGRFVVFSSGGDVYVYDRATGTTELVSVPIPPTTIGQVTLTPRAPGAGKRLVAAAPVTVSGRSVAKAKVTCLANVAGRAVRAIEHALDRGVARCVWKLPSWSTGESLDAQLAVRTPNGPAKRGFLVDIAGVRHALAWRVVATGDDVPVLADIVALSPRDVWAVGGGKNPIVHWDGMRLRHYGAPELSEGRVELTAIAAVAADDVWAVGSAGSAPLALHWDGRSWKPAQLPSVADASLNDVAAIGAKDVWAVGGAGDGPLALHWDGEMWSVADLRAVGRSPSELYALDGISRDAVWAVGGKNLDEVEAGLAELVLRWDGLSWKPASLGKKYSERTAIDVLSQTDVWTLGSDLSYDNFYYVLHWDGRRGTRYESGNTYGISATSPTRVFVVGYDGIDHWNGTRLRSQPAAFVGQHDAHLNAVSALSATEAWAVGDHILVRYSR